MNVMKADVWHMAADGSLHLKRTIGNNFSLSFAYAQDILKGDGDGEEIIIADQNWQSFDFPLCFRISCYYFMEGPRQ